MAASVLVVDDAEDTREMYATFLRYEGFDVAVADDGASALALAKAYIPNVIVLDLTMPRMDGFQVARRLRLDERTSAIPIIAVSGLNRQRDVAEAIAAGINGYCVKPCLPETLLEEINRLLRR